MSEISDIMDTMNTNMDTIHKVQELSSEYYRLSLKLQMMKKRLAELDKNLKEEFDLEYEDEKQ